MTTPEWIQWLLRRLAGPERADDVLGDLEEAHLRRVSRSGRLLATVLTGLAAVDMAVALLRGKRRRRDATEESTPRRTPTGGRRRIPRVSWLDFKLGLRMLARYPGLTVVGGLAMAFGIAIGASTFQFGRELVSPDLPYADADRIVGLQNVSSITTRPDARALHDLPTWRAELRSIENVGASHRQRHNLAIGDEEAHSRFCATILPAECSNRTTTRGSHEQSGQSVPRPGSPPTRSSLRSGRSAHHPGGSG